MARPASEIARTLRAAGAHRLRPGLYSLDGVMHVDAEELLIDQGIPVTPENIDALADAAERLAGAHGIPASTVEW